MVMGWETIHVWANFSEDDFGETVPNAWDGAQPLDLILPRLHALGNLHTTRLNGVME
ncbi:MAG: hypothetical protein NVS2B7_22750 [Herpetosiphon sp.]